jgi:hypothetical protein
MAVPVRCFSLANTGDGPGFSGFPSSFSNGSSFIIGPRFWLSNLIGKILGFSIMSGITFDGSGFSGFPSSV